MTAWTCARREWGAIRAWWRLRAAAGRARRARCRRPASSAGRCAASTSGPPSCSPTTVRSSTSTAARDGCPGMTMAEIAAEHADAMREAFAGPVDLLGMSTGGSIAQQVAAEHPDVVRRLVLVSTGCRLGPAGSPPPAAGRRARARRCTAPGGGGLRGRSRRRSVRSSCQRQSPAGCSLRACSRPRA